MKTFFFNIIILNPKLNIDQARYFNIASSQTTHLDFRRVALAECSSETCTSYFTLNNSQSCSKLLKQGTNLQVSAQGVFNQDLLEEIHPVLFIPHTRQSLSKESQ